MTIRQRRAWWLILAVVAACAQPTGPSSLTREHVGPLAPVAVDIVPQGGHEDQVEAVVFSPDGKRIASGGDDNAVRIWDVETGQLVRVLNGHTEQVGAVAFSPDGRLVVSGSWDHTARVWNLATGRTLATFTGHTDHVTALAFADDSTIVSGGGDGNLYRWSAATGSATSMPCSDLGYVRSLALTPDRAQIVVAGSSGEIVACDARRGGILSRIQTDQGQIHALGLDAAGRRVASAGDDGTLKVWELASGHLVYNASAGRQLFSTALSPDGRLAVSGSLDGAVVLHDLDHQQPRALMREGRTVMAAAFSWDGRSIATAGADRSVRVWDATSGEQILTLAGNHDMPYAVAVSSDGRRLVTGTGGHMRSWEVHVWDLDLVHHRYVLLGHTAAINAVAVSDDGRRAVTGDHSGGVKLWDIDRGVLLHDLQPPDQIPIYAVAFVPGTNLVAAAGYRGVVAFFDADTGARTRELELGGYAIQSIAFSANGSRMMVGTFAPALIDVASGRVLFALQGDLGRDTVALAPDGRRALVSTHDGPAELIDLDDGRVLQQLDGQSYTSFVAFSHDGARVFTAGGSNFSVWDSSSGRPLATRPVGDFKRLAIAQDGAMAVTTRTDGTVHASPAGISLVASGEEWLAYDPDGYFDASRRGGALVAAVRGLDPFRIDQIALRNNRPDLLLARIGLAPAQLVAQFLALHEGRLARVLHGADAGDAMARAPEVKLTALSRDGENVTLAARITDTSGALLSYNVYVNDVPIFAGTGKRISGAASSITERVQLAPGRNKIEVGALNASGIESLRPYRIVESSRVAKGDLYFIGIGVSRYKNDAYDLKYAHKDVLDLAAVLSKTGGAFDHVHVSTYVDDQATTDAIRRARADLAHAHVEDTVIVLIAGHGLHANNGTGDYYFATHELDLHDLEHTAIRYELIEALVQGIAPRRKLLLLDTCESGEVESGADPVETRSLAALRPRTTRALVRARRESAHSVAARPERDRFIDNDLARRTGAIVFSSSRGEEFSYELDDIQHGVFTAEIITALTTDRADANHDGWVSSDELRTYVSRAVAAHTDDLQHPTVDRDNLEQPILLPVIRGM